MRHHFPIDDGRARGVALRERPLRLMLIMVQLSYLLGLGLLREEVLPIVQLSLEDLVFSSESSVIEL